MENYEYYRDLLPAFLNGESGDDERREIEKALTADPRLAADLRELRQLQTGLAIMDKVEGDHISVELLVAYADDPKRLGKTEITALEQHLERCDECRDEIMMCRSPIEGQEPSVGFISNIRAWLSQPRLVRPVWGAAVLILLAVPAVYLGYERTTGFGVEPPAFRLRAGVSRGVDQRQTIMLESNAVLVPLEIVTPTMPQRSYGLEVFDTDDRLLTAVYQLEPAKDNLITVSLARAHLPDGVYHIKVIEYDTNFNPTESFDFDLQIKSTN